MLSLPRRDCLRIPPHSRKGGRSALTKLICLAAWLIQRTTGPGTTGETETRGHGESVKRSSWGQGVLLTCCHCGMRDGDCGKSRSLAKIAKIVKTNLLASVHFFFAPFASLREDRPGSLAKIAKKSLFCSPLRPYRISPLEPFLSAGRLIALLHATHQNRSLIPAPHCVRNDISPGCLDAAHVRS